MTDNRFDYVMNEFDEIEYITDIVDCEDRDFADFLDYVNKMAKENEQLKQTNQELYDDLQFCMSCKSLKMGENSILKKESEQLKFENENLKSILNDFINICNRLQSNPNDKQTLGVARDMLQNMGVDLND